jgi:heterotetrameric sarcosine oxidase gamma subunit
MIQMERDKMSEARVETPLHYIRESESKPLPGSVEICESPQLGFLSLRADLADKQFISSVQETVGVSVPSPLRFCRTDDSAIYWQGPSECLLIVPAGHETELETNLREKLQGHFALTDVSGGFSQISLHGEAVPTLLKKASAYDFDPQVFAEGRCVSTVVAKTTALISRHSDGVFNMVIRRSFAHYLARWLLDASSEFGATFELAR